MVSGAANALLLVPLAFAACAARRRHRLKGTVAGAPVLLVNNSTEEVLPRVVPRNLATSLLDVLELVNVALFQMLGIIGLQPLHVAARGAEHLRPALLLSTLAALLDDDAPERQAPGLHSVLRETIDTSAITKALVADALRLGSVEAALGTQDGQGRSPLLIAVQRSDAPATRALLAMRAAPDVGDTRMGWSPLMFAVSAGHRDMAELLVRGGAAIDFVARPHGYTPLLAALGLHNEALAAWLVDAGTDLAHTVRTLRTNASHFGKELEMLRRILADRGREASLHGGSVGPLHEKAPLWAAFGD